MKGLCRPALALAALLAACTASPASAPTPSAGESPATAPASPIAPPSNPPRVPPRSPGGAVDDCAAAVYWQLAYEVPGMDAVEVTCDIVYKQIAGANATLDLYLPRQAASGAALPAVVFVHGNGDIAELKPIDEHWKRDQYTAARVVAALGYAAISFDYRGYDLPERLVDAEQDVLDLLAFVGATAGELHIDPDRVCLWSVSGGGLPAAWASIFGDPQPICTVLISAGFAGAPPEADPVAAIDPDMAPVFLAHGAQDSYANPDRFVEAAATSAVTVSLHAHPGRHGWESAADSEQQRIVGLALDFLRQHLGGG